MKKERNIIQFLPYFPPHIGGVEKVGEDIFLKWTYGISSLFSGCQQQESDVYFDHKYNQDLKERNFQKIFFPDFEIVDNFPVPKIWTLLFWKQWRKMKEEMKNIGEREDIFVITHTRFFISSLMGGIFARKHKLTWIHIEHGSDYVKLSSNMKNKIAYFYDRMLGKWIFKKADRVLCISEASKAFVTSEFGRLDAKVWCRGIDFPVHASSRSLKQNFSNKKIIGYIGRLYKWKNVESLCEAYISLDQEIKSNSQLVIIGGGEDYSRLTSRYSVDSISFLGEKSFEESFVLQSEFDIHVHPSSAGGGLATTLLQAMYHGSLIIATPNEGASEVIEDGKNGILLKDDSVSEISRGIMKAMRIGNTQAKFANENTKILKEKFSHEKNLEKLYSYLDL